MFEIEKDIEQQNDVKNFPFSKMESGDSFYFDKEVHIKVRNAARHFANKQKKDFSELFKIRKYEFGYRIWKK